MRITVAVATGNFFVDFFFKYDILFFVMKETTQEHIRDQGIAIAGVRGALQALAEPDAWATKQYLQQRITIMEEKLAEIQNKLAEIEFSEDLAWLDPLSDEAVIKSLRERGIDERSIAGEDELAAARKKRLLSR